jgi:hypothetical protein
MDMAQSAPMVVSAQMESTPLPVAVQQASQEPLAKLTSMNALLILALSTAYAGSGITKHSPLK